MLRLNNALPRTAPSLLTSLLVNLLLLGGLAWLVRTELPATQGIEVVLDHAPAVPAPPPPSARPRPVHAPRAVVRPVALPHQRLLPIVRRPAFPVTALHDGARRAVNLRMPAPRRPRLTQPPALPDTQRPEPTYATATATSTPGRLQPSSSPTPQQSAALEHSLPAMQPLTDGADPVRDPSLENDAPSGLATGALPGKISPSSTRFGGPRGVPGTGGPSGAGVGSSRHTPTAGPDPGGPTLPMQPRGGAHPGYAGGLSLTHTPAPAPTPAPTPGIGADPAVGRGHPWGAATSAGSAGPGEGGNTGGTGGNPGRFTAPDGGGGSHPGAVHVRTKPPYPASARRRGIEGDVLVHVFLDAQCRMARPPEVLQSSGNRELDDAALRYVSEGRGLLFSPALKDGKPVATTLKVCVQFRLD